MASRDAEHALERARRAHRAAAVLIADRQCDPADAVGPLVRGWDALAEALDRASGRALVSDPPDVLSRLFERRGETLRQEVPRLYEATGRAEGGDGAQPPSRRDLRRQLRLLGRAVRVARRKRMSRRARARQLAPAAGTLLLVATLLSVVWWTVGERGGRGWRGRYYPKPGFEGTPVVSADPSIDFRWFRDSAWLGGPSDQFSVRWDTCLELDERRKLEVRLGSDDGSRLFVDGKKRIDNWRNQKFRWVTRTLHLDAGMHHVRVEYFEGSSDAGVTAEIMAPGLPPEPLPMKHFRMPADDNPCGDTLPASK